MGAGAARPERAVLPDGDWQPIGASSTDDVHGREQLQQFDDRLTGTHFCRAGRQRHVLVTVKFNVTQNNPNPPCTVGNFTTTGLPATASATFSATSVTSPSNGADQVVTMTVAAGTTAPGTYNGTVSATGSTNCSGTQSATFQLRVGTPTSLTLNAPSPASVTQGSAGPVALSATLTSGAVLLTGQPIEFRVNGITVGSGTTNASAVATFNYNPSALSTGSYTITAFYDGANNVAGSPRGAATSGPQTLTVTSASVATTTSINAPGITYGQNGSVTVTVSANSGSNTPTGNVSLSVDGGAAVTKTLVNGSYTFTSR